MGHPAGPARACARALRAASPPKARYYYPNGKGSGGCSAAGLVAAYGWLGANGVTTANQSFSCLAEGIARAADAERTIVDWYARRFNMAISVAAGNMNSGPNEPACMFTRNATCVGAALLGGTGMACNSSWTNQNAYPNFERTDREEPDVVAFGGPETANTTLPGCPDAAGPKVELAALTGTSDWVQHHGTSFAAPAIASLTALCKQVSLGVADDETSIRAIMKVAGWFRNPRDFNYSSTSDSFTSQNDWRDGGGGVVASVVKAMCDGSSTGPGGPVVSVTRDPGALQGDVWPFGNSDCAACGLNDPPLGGRSVRPLLWGRPSMADATRLYRELSRFTLREGQRLRAVIAWDSCPGSADMGSFVPAPIGTDYDLFLLKDGQLVYSSQSISDVTEGFDVTIAGGQDGTYQVVKGLPANLGGCDGQGYEPYSYAFAVTQ